MQRTRNYSRVSVQLAAEFECFKTPKYRKPLDFRILKGLFGKIATLENVLGIAR